MTVDMLHTSVETYTVRDTTVSIAGQLYMLHQAHRIIVVSLKRMEIVHEQPIPASYVA